jgi:hypothetical protein
LSDVQSIIDELKILVEKIDEKVTENLHQSSANMQLLDFSEEDLSLMRKKDKLLLATRRALEKAIYELNLLNESS